MKNIDKNLKDLISDIDSLLKKYDLEDYSIDSIDLIPMAMPIEDEFGEDKKVKKTKKGKTYEVKKMSDQKLKIELTNKKK